MSKALDDTMRILNKAGDNLTVEDVLKVWALLPLFDNDEEMDAARISEGLYIALAPRDDIDLPNWLADELFEEES